MRWSDLWANECVDNQQQRCARAILHSLLVIGGLPSGHLLIRRMLNARRPTPRESAVLDGAFTRILIDTSKRPRHIFVLDKTGPNAAVSGTTLFVWQELMTTYRAFLPAILAHELGHLHNRDGRLLLALRTLVIPGAYTLASVLLMLLQAAQVVLIAVLNIFIRLLALGFLVGMLQRLCHVFLVHIPQYIIIFAMGGLGPKMMALAWERHFIEREFAADAFAARCGQRWSLIDFFRSYTLDDVALPWSERRTHPPTSERIARLIQAADGPADHIRYPDRMDAHHINCFHGPDKPAGPASARPWWTTSIIYVLAALIVIGIVWAALLAADLPLLQFAQPDTPSTPVGPTPTLGILLQQ